MKWRHMESKERREQEKQQAASGVASNVNKAASPATSITSTSSVAPGVAVTAAGPPPVMPRFPPFLHHTVQPGSLHGKTLKTFRIVGYHFFSRLSATLNNCLIYFKIIWALAILLEHMPKKFEINRTKIKGGCQSGRKMVTNNSKSDLPLILKTNLSK